MNVFDWSRADARVEQGSVWGGLATTNAANVWKEQMELKETLQMLPLSLSHLLISVPAVPPLQHPALRRRRTWWSPGGGRALIRQHKSQLHSLVLGWFFTFSVNKLEPGRWYSWTNPPCGPFVDLHQCLVGQVGDEEGDEIVEQVADDRGRQTDFASCSRNLWELPHQGRVNVVKKNFLKNSWTKPFHCFT